MSKIEKKILAHLEDEDILDVYFDSGRLVYINEWDESAVRMIIRVHFPQFDPANVIYNEEPEYFSKVGY
jgi:hypothetical protein